MDIYTRDLVRSGHGTIGTPVISDPEGKGVLICKLRRGQELRIKCIAKKVQFCFSSTYRTGCSEGACEMVSCRRRFLRVRPAQ